MNGQISQPCPLSAAVLDANKIAASSFGDYDWFTLSAVMAPFVWFTLSAVMAPFVLIVIFLQMQVMIS